MKTITSAENADFKHALKLAEASRERKKCQQTLLDGEHLISAYCAAGYVPEWLFVLDTQLKEALNTSFFRALIETGWNQNKLIVVNAQLMRQLSALDSPSTMVAVIMQPKNAAMPNADADVLVLESLQDPGNMGSILRSAAAAGFVHVLCSPDCVAAWSPKVLRAAQGAHFSLKITESVDLEAYVAAAKQTSYALALQATTSLYECAFKAPSIVLIGNEGAGLSSALLKVSNRLIRIPMPGKVESLNAAAAAAICLFEIVRRRAG
jgi:RNA methyltransferase, TrmH family